MAWKAREREDQAIPYLVGNLRRQHKDMVQISLCYLMPPPPNFCTYTLNAKECIIIYSSVLRMPINLDLQFQQRFKCWQSMKSYSLCLKVRCYLRAVHNGECEHLCSATPSTMPLFPVYQNILIIKLDIKFLSDALPPSKRLVIQVLTQKPTYLYAWEYHEGSALWNLRSLAIDLSEDPRAQYHQ